MLARLPYSSDDRRDGISGMAYAMRSVAQLLLMCDRQDIGLSVDTGSPESAAVGRGAMATKAPLVAGVDPKIFVYDNYPGGIGFSAPLFRMQDDLLRATRQLVTECECDAGCPSCVGPIGETGPLAKRVAIELLDLIGPGPALVTGDADASFDASFDPGVLEAGR
jgi:DEAD/DEAH box helicase domain-containing protein